MKKEYQAPEVEKKLFVSTNEFTTEPSTQPLSAEGGTMPNPWWHE